MCVRHEPDGLDPWMHRGGYFSDAGVHDVVLVVFAHARTAPTYYALSDDVLLCCLLFRSYFSYFSRFR